jgi:hypothetical protein
MSDAAFAKCACQACAVHLEFPLEAAGARIVCPQCGQETELTVAAPDAGSPAPAPDAPDLTLDTLNASFAQRLNRTRVSFVYQAGLAIVALTMVVLPLIYLAMIAAAGWAVYYWATHFTFLLASGGRARVWLFKPHCSRAVSCCSSWSSRCLREGPCRPSR